MDPDQIIKSAPELLKHGAELVGALKLTEIAKTMLGPATGEFAERVRDEIRLYRFGRQLELLKKAEKMVHDAGFPPKAVPIKLLFPLLEGASLEENDDLHTMWAALLANAASENSTRVVRPLFTSILRQMSPDDARVLNLLVERVSRKGDASDMFLLQLSFNQEALAYVWDVFEEARFGTATPIESAKPYTYAKPYNFSGRVVDFQVCICSLEAQRLIMARDEFVSPQALVMHLVTVLGCEFALSCRPPKPKA
jgi:hypothetical protein